MSFFARPEFWVIVALALLFFGPKRLPEMGSAIGKTIREFQASMKDAKPEIAPPTETPVQITTTTAPVITAPVTPAAPAATAPSATVTPVAPATPVEASVD
ncbi:MAG: twin-arginine translocase TatA/TatE family subunit [Ktedonobacterales bacterium]